MRAYWSKLLGSSDVEALPPPAQWAVMDAAYDDIGTARVGTLFPLLLILALPAVTGVAWPLAWFAAAAAATAGGWFAARRFKHVAAAAPVASHVRRFMLASAAQVAVLGAGGGGAVWGSHLELCLLAALPIGFAMMNVCATARIARAASLQVALLGVPIVAACIVQSLRGHGASGFASLACVFSVWAIGAGLLARGAATRHQKFALAVLEGGRAAAKAGAKPEIGASETFQRLHGRDQVTGLLNGYSFAHVVAQAEQRTTLGERPMSLILLDWDGFESFAARRTQQETSAKLIDVARRVRGTLHRQSDDVARLGDGRFGIVLAGTDAFGANVVAENLVAALNRTQGDSPVGAVAVPVKLSIGIASYCGRGPLPEGQLMHFAGDALRYAKVNGGSQIRRHDDAAHAMRPALQNPPPTGPIHENAKQGPVIDATPGASILAIGHVLEQTK
jgi:diguanylate cyclase (GGDEF)-like protein